jgi:DNA-binding transcriptional LysR family regulator
MTPTATGRAMYAIYLPILRDLAGAHQSMKALTGEVSGPASVGVVFSMSERVLLPAIRSFNERYPGVRLSIVEGYTTTLIEWVSAAKVDFAITIRPTRKVTLAAEHILSGEFILASNAHLKTRVPGTISFKSLAKLKLVLPSRLHHLRTILDEYAGRAGIDLAPKMELDSVNAIADLVACTDYFTVLPATTLHNGLAAGLLRSHRIVSPKVARDLIAVHHPRRPLSTAALALKEMLRKQLVEISRPPP